MRRLLLSLALLLTLGAPCASAAVVFDAVAHNSTATAGTSIPNFTLTIGGGVTSGAVLVPISFETTVPTAVAVTVGGASASLIASTTATNGTVCQTQLWGLATGSATGAKTISVSWTGSSGAAAGAISFSGVDQATPFNNGTTVTPTTDAAAVPESITITSTSGDLTFDWNVNNGGNTQPTSPTQTSRFSFTHADFNFASAGSTGPGTGTATHTWTFGAFEFVAMSGVNVKAAAGGAGCTDSHMMGVWRCDEARP